MNNARLDGGPLAVLEPTTCKLAQAMLVLINKRLTQPEPTSLELSVLQELSDHLDMAISRGRIEDIEKVALAITLLVPST